MDLGRPRNDGPPVGRNRTCGDHYPSETIHDNLLKYTYCYR